MKQRNSMDGITKYGRFLFGIAIVVLGIESPLIYAGHAAGLELLPQWILPGHAFLAYLAGVALIGAGIIIAIDIKPRSAAILLGGYFFLSFLFLRTPRMALILRDVGERTRAFETLALCGGAWVLAGTLPIDSTSARGWGIVADKAMELGRFFLAISMAVFGIDHFVADSLVAGLLPSWLPWHFFWAYLTGFGFIAAAVAIATRKYVRLAAILLGLMFFSVAVLVHAPRLATHLTDSDEWSSGFMALAMAGTALVTSGIATNRATAPTGSLTARNASPSCPGGS